MTKKLFRDDAYMHQCDAIVIAHTDHGVIFDQTVFYATSGGQAGDVGFLDDAIITGAVYAENKSDIVHLTESRPAIGSKVTLSLDWEKRHAKMRMHTGLHLLSVVLAYPVTGGSINDTESRLDFDMPDVTMTKDEMSLKLNTLIMKNAAVSETYITDAELEANPTLVKTMSVKPPMGTGRVRLVRIVGLDLQPCGGTHVKNTGEIGRMLISAIEKKGKQNRRVRVVFA
jgi:misacylated tRNA(Ala) deacylase